jgi:hypothetical protein
MAWDKSFARIQCAKRAVIDCGWSPLTYVLLDHPDIRRCNKNLQNNDDDNQQQSLLENGISITESEDSSTLTFRINNTGPAMSVMLDKMILEQSKSLAH